MNEDKYRLTNEVWKQLVKDCQFHIPIDPNSHLTLCNNHKSKGTVPQHNGTKRCNILCCPRAAEVYANVKKIQYNEQKAKELKRVESARTDAIRRDSNVVRLAYTERNETYY